MIAYLLRGKPAWRVRQLSDELADVFGLEPISSRIPPHVTLKAPFETSSERNIEELKVVLADFIKGRAPAALAYEGFGQFDKRVVFIYIKPSPAAGALIADLAKTLRRLPWVRFTRTDGEKHLHATIAYAERRSQFEEIKKYLADESVHLDGAIDNISILVQEKDHRSPWKLLAEYSFVTLPTEPEL